MEAFLVLAAVNERSGKVTDVLNACVCAKITQDCKHSED